MEFFNTKISERTIECVSEVLRSGWLSEGQRVRQFEDELTKVLGLENPVCVNSGTSALQLALTVAGVKRGDEVILPAQTFIATGLAILNVGGVPVFADIDPQTGNIAPESVKQHLSERTKAVIPVHWAGYPCDMDELNSIGSAHAITVVEDAAHALGATYRDRPIGAVSEFTCFSFQAIKHLTTGDGGALCCNSVEDTDRAKALRWFGIDRKRSKPSILGERAYDLTEPGFKYHMNDLAATLGSGNLESFPQRLERRRVIAEKYRTALSNVAGVTLLRNDQDRSHAYWLFTLLAERREDFIRKLKEAGVPASVVHLRIDKYSVFGGARDELAGQAEFDEKQVSIPVHEGLSDSDVDTVIRAIRSGW